MNLRNAIVVSVVVVALSAIGILYSRPTTKVVRISIGTQDTTINCVAGGGLIRERKFLEKHLPRTGKYEGVEFDVSWQNFTSGPPLTNAMVGDRLDIGALGDFPAVLNGVTFEQSGNGVKSVCVAVLAGSVLGAGNAVLVPIDSPAQSLADLKGKEIATAFGSAAHGMLLRAATQLGWDTERDLQVVNQTAEIGGAGLKAGTLAGYSAFVPFGELFPFRGFARKLYDGSSAGQPTCHCVVVRSDFAAEHPDLVTAFLKASLEASRQYADAPEATSEEAAAWSGVEAEAYYLFHGPAGIQSRDYSFKPEYVRGLTAARDTLRQLHPTAADFDVQRWIDDRYIRRAATESGLSYDARLQSYEPEPIVGADFVSGKPLGDVRQVGQVWVGGEPQVRHYDGIPATLRAVAELNAAAKPIRTTYLHDRKTGLKLFGAEATLVVAADGEWSAFGDKSAAVAWAAEHDGRVLDFDAAQVVAQGSTR